MVGGWEGDVVFGAAFGAGEGSAPKARNVIAQGSALGWIRMNFESAEGAK